MTDDLVERLRESAVYWDEFGFHVTAQRDREAADRIELLERLVSYLAGANKDHVRVMLAGNPIVCGEIISKSLAALGGKKWLALLLKRLREDAPRWARDEKGMLAKQLEAAADRIEELEQQITGLESVVEELIDEDAADRIEELEYALRSIAEVPIGAEIPDRTTIWGFAKHMQETAKDALREETR